jgi:hypothetical protein
MMRNPASLTPLLLGLLTATACSPALAEEGGWTFEVTPYLFGAAMKGKAGTSGVTAEVDMSFGDILDTLDAGFMAYLTARKGPWVLGLDTTYMKLSDEGSKSVSGPFGRVGVKGALDVTNDLYVTQASGGYRIIDDRTKLDVIAGLRYTKLKVEADVTIATTPGIVFSGGTRSASETRDWTDAVVGFHLRQPLSQTWAIDAYADVGGSSGSNTYQVMVGANWEFSPGYSAKLGYREISWDYEKDNFVWDMKARGLYLGVGIAF